MRGHDDGVELGCGLFRKTDGAGRGGGGGGGGGAPANTPQANAAQVAAAGQGGANALQAAPIPGTGGITPQAFHNAFDNAPGARQNFVTVADLREGIGGTRAEQDAAIRTMVAGKQYSLDSHEGRYVDITPHADRGAFFQMPSSTGFWKGPDGRTYEERLVYIARR